MIFFKHLKFRLSATQGVSRLLRSDKMEVTLLGFALVSEKVEVVR